MFTKFLVALIASLPLLLSLAGQADAQMVDSRIRYTSGAVVRTGWEKELVQGQKNLKNYYWGAMVDYTQAYKKVPLPSRPELDAFRNKTASDSPAAYHYTKPVHLALPRRDFTPVADINKDVSARLSSPQVSAKLSAPQVSAKLSAPQVTGKFVRAEAGYENAVSAKLTKPAAPKQEIATYSDMPTTPVETYSSRGSVATGEVRGRLLR
jgi:hypothetical protein